MLLVHAHCLCSALRHCAGLLLERSSGLCLRCFQLHMQDLPVHALLLVSVHAFPAPQVLLDALQVQPRFDVTDVRRQQLALRACNIIAQVGCRATGQASGLSLNRMLTGLVKVAQLPKDGSLENAELRRCAWGAVHNLVSAPSRLSLHAIWHLPGGTVSSLPWSCHAHQLRHQKSGTVMLPAGVGCRVRPRPGCCLPVSA